ncbi:PTS sugar transporter subunit IIB [Enterococcus faecium]
MKILLICNAGMSTGIMQVKLKEEATKRGVDADVEAVPVSEIDEHLEGADFILLGPQIRFAENDIKQQAGDTPVFTINTQDFGLMRADNVFNQIEKLSK